MSDIFLSFVTQETGAAKNRFQEASILVTSSLIMVLLTLSAPT